MTRMTDIRASAAALAARIGLNGLAIAVLALLLAVQTVRIEGFKLWPLSVEGWKPRAERLGADLKNVRQAQGVAQAKAQAAKDRAELEYRELAERIDDEADHAEAGALAAAERHIAANLVRCEIARGRSSGPAATAPDRSAGGGQALPGAGQLDRAVAVSADDVRACTVNTLQANAARDWALGLEAAGGN